MDLEDFRAAVRTRIGANANDTFHTNARLNEQINSAVETFSSEYRWPWLIDTATVTITSGSTSVPVPADWAYTLSLVINGAHRQALWPAALTDIDRLTLETGMPTVYADAGDNLVVAPTPDGGYTATMRYFRVENVLSDNAHEPLAPDRYAAVIVAYAAYLALASENRVDEAQIAVSEYQGRVTRLAKQVNRQGRPTAARVRPGHGWG